MHTHVALTLGLALAIGTPAPLAPLAPFAPLAPKTSQEAKQEPYEPRVGQAGKDVVWVPTPEVLLNLMLDLARITKDDFVMDLGSGDGRNIIGAAKRGARGVGVEYNPDMVALSRRRAQEAGVAHLATFVQGDMYEADISKANAMVIFLLPTNMDKLMPSFKSLAPGSRIVSNTFSFGDWDPDVRQAVKDGTCEAWCEALLWIVPAQAAGTWAMPEGTLTLTQIHQVLYGTLSGVTGEEKISKAKMLGYDISFTAGDRAYTGTLKGTTMEGTVTTAGGSPRAWKATRMK
jgi:SAM-dependent methyltransferase